MSIPFYSSLNMNGNTIENAEGLEGGSSVYLEKPEAPVKGDIYFNSSEGKLEIYSGYNWVVYDSNAITTTTDYSGSISTTDCYAVSPGVATFAGSKFYIKFHRAPKSTTGTIGLAVGSLGQISFVNPDGSNVQCSQIKSGMVVQFYLVSLKTAKLITPIPTNVTVEDNLTSTSATNALSANQGNILLETITKKFTNQLTGTTDSPINWVDYDYGVYGITGVFRTYSSATYTINRLAVMLIYQNAYDEKAALIIDTSDMGLLKVHALRSIKDDQGNYALGSWGNDTYIGNNNITEFIPYREYGPATKKYVDDSINSLGSSDYKINEPVLIGTWIDKPLYRTIQVATLDTNTMEDNTITLDDLTSETNIPVHIYGYTYLSAADKVIYFDNHKNTAGTTTGIYIAEYHPDTRILDYYIAANTAGEIRAEGGNTKLYFIIEYFENN